MAEQIQSAYWNPAAVAIHTGVMYYNCNSHQNIVTISDDLTHNTTSVYAIIKKMMPEVRKLVPNLSKVYYLSDSPTSQYRNKTIFQIVSYYKEDFGVPCVWYYLEAGHGKGPCDGLGAAVKRSASRAIAQGRVIQSPKDFYEWTKNISSSVKYVGVFTEEIAEASSILFGRGKSLQSVCGTMKIHAVAGEDANRIVTRDLPCCCQTYLVSPGTSSCGCSSHFMVPNDDAEQLDNQTSVLDTEPTANEDVPTLDGQNDIEEGSWVASVYEGDWFIGKVMNLEGN